MNAKQMAVIRTDIWMAASGVAVVAMDDILELVFVVFFIVAAVVQFLVSLRPEVEK